MRMVGKINRPNRRNFHRCFSMGFSLYFFFRWRYSFRAPDNSREINWLPPENRPVPAAGLQPVRVIAVPRQVRKEAIWPPFQREWHSARIQMNGPGLYKRLPPSCSCIGPSNSLCTGLLLKPFHHQRTQPQSTISGSTWLIFSWQGSPSFWSSRSQ